MHGCLRMIRKGDFCVVISDLFTLRSDVPIYMIDRLDELRKGGIVERGTPVVVLSDPENLKAFITKTTIAS